MPDDLFLTKWRASIETQHAALVVYLQSKTVAQDWHAVADAACDLRELDAQLALIDAQRQA